MKKKWIRKSVALLMGICMLVGLLSDMAYAAAEQESSSSLGEEFDSDLYSYSYTDGKTTITIPEENLAKFISDGYLEKWKSVEINRLWMHIHVYSEDTVIPKELLNWAGTKEGSTYLYMKDDGQDYEWRFDRTSSQFQDDFKPQVSFYDVTASESGFSGDTTCFGVHTNYSSVNCSTAAKFSVNRFRLNGELIDVSEYFKNFYDTYNTDEIKRVISGIDYSYSYFNNPQPTGDVGWFYASCEKDGAVKSVTRDACWTWSQNMKEIKGHLEFNNMDQVDCQDFIVSDKPTTDTDITSINSFSIIGSSSVFEPVEDQGGTSLGEEFDSGLYGYFYENGMANIMIPEKNLRKFISDGYLEKWKSVELNELWLNITIYSENTVIPKELLNWTGTKNGYTHIYMYDDGQDYEWRFDRTSSQFQDDFKPQVSFYDVTASESGFSGDTTCFGVHTNYSSANCSTAAKFSVNRFRLNGELIDVSEYFKNFYDTYNTDEIKQETSETDYSYSYFNNNSPTGDIGWFYASFEKDGVIKSVTRDSCWTWSHNMAGTSGHLEFNNMDQIGCQDFIVSDKPTTGTDTVSLNSFSIIGGQSVSGATGDLGFSGSTGDPDFSGSTGNSSSDDQLLPVPIEMQEKTRIITWDDWNPPMLKLNIADMDEVVQSGQLQQWVDMYNNLYIEIYIYDRDRVIPKEFFNIIRQKNISLYIFVDFGTEVYEWGLLTNKYFEVKKDFSPYITYERTRTTEAYFPEGTTALTFQTDCTPEVFSGGLVQKLSLNRLVIDGESIQTSVIFKNFFQKYCIPEILEGNMYSYRGEFPDSVEKGYFYLSNYNDERGSLDGAAKDSLWQYYEDFYLDGSGRDRAHVEMNDMVMSNSGTFVISDQPPLGSDPENMHEIFAGNNKGYTEYGADNLKEHFEGEDVIDAKSAASADFVEAAQEVGADIVVEKEGVEFTLDHEDIKEDIAFEPDIQNGQQSEEVEELLEQRGLEEKEHDVVDFENAFSKEEGKLPGEVDVDYPIGSTIGQMGDEIRIYYYNFKTDSLELIAIVKLDDKGFVHFSLKHFSKYVIVNAEGAPKETIPPEPTESAMPEPTESSSSKPAETAIPQPVETTAPQPTALSSPQTAGSQPAMQRAEMQGKVFADKKGVAKYKVTGNQTVTYQKGKKAKKAVIPDTVVLNGYSFKVTAIAANAFYQDKKLQQLTIGKNIAKIGKKAFSGCKNLKSVTVRTKKLKLAQIGSAAFAGTKPKKLVMPGPSKSKYQKWFRKRGMKAN